MTNFYRADSLKLVFNLKKNFFLGVRLAKQENKIKSARRWKTAGSSGRITGTGGQMC